jgi:hypothetical protein
MTSTSYYLFKLDRRYNQFGIIQVLQTDRVPLFRKPVIVQELFFAVSNGKLALVTNE